MATQHKNEPLAIVGLGCRWPGGAHDGSQFWEFLRDKVDGWREFDEPRFSKQGFHHSNRDRPGGFAMEGAFLAEQDARLFDHSFFGMTSLEVETMDPSQRKLLEVAYEAIENAGETWESIASSRTGVFVGNFCLDHWMIQSRDWDHPRPYAFVGAGTSILANRISYIFDLHGPSLTVDTACSSSMYALHLAVNSIRAGDCEAAIVASANWIGDPSVQIALDKLGALSASGRCHTFDARAQGYARGEGYGAIYLKRPSLAVKDGPPIRAIIRGTAINSNGRTGGITRPSAQGQERVIREAYRDADLSFQDTSYFECHGTGTYVGDPIEMAAVGNVFAPERRVDDPPLLVGSVKSNVGHGEGASALASIMKIILALENQSMPPILDLQARNPNIDFAAARIEPVTELTPWPKDRLQRASINSFGYGGANAHCIIDHVRNFLPDYIAPGVFRTNVNGHPSDNRSNGHRAIHHRSMLSPLMSSAKADATTRQLVLLPMSAHSKQSLDLNLGALSRVISGLSLADVAYTLSARRSRFSQRSFCIVNKDEIGPGSQDLVLDRKPVRAPLRPVNVGFIFTGQGAQWQGMGGGLFGYRVFRNTIEYLDHVLNTLPLRPSWSLYNVLSGKCDKEFIHTAEASQAACTALQVGVIDLLASWSIRPAGVAGHSSGEIAAAYAAGRITSAEAIVAAFLRGRAVSKNGQVGAMLAVGLGSDDVTSFTEGREVEVRVAAFNSPGSVTLSGEERAIDDISNALTDAGVFNRKLKTNGNAYHSHHMIPVGGNYVELLLASKEDLKNSGLDAVDQGYEHKLWVSSVSPSESTDALENMAEYWKKNLESPVRFSEAVTRLLSSKDVSIQAVIEIGPHPALKSPLEQIFKTGGMKVSYSYGLKRQEDGQKTMLQLAGTLFSWNATVDLAAVNAVDAVSGTGLEHGCTCTDLPPYQYTYEGLHYHESRPSRQYRYRDVLRHDLLGSKVVGTAKLRPQWRNILQIKDVPWLSDHRLGLEAVLPGTSYIAMAVEAVSRAFNESRETLDIDAFSLADVSINNALSIPEDDYGIEVVTSLDLVSTTTYPSSATWSTFSISSVQRGTEKWTEHCNGRVKVEVGRNVNFEQAARPAPDLGVADASRIIDASAWYRRFAEIGLNYGPAFQSLSRIRATPNVPNQAVATINLHTTSVPEGESRYPVHPASLDGAIQLGLIACSSGRPSEARNAFVPVHLSRLYLSNTIDMLTRDADAYSAVAHGERRGVRGAELDLQILGPAGELLVRAEGLRCVSYSRAARPTAAATDRAFSSPFTRLVWRPDIRALRAHEARRRYPPPEKNVAQAPAWGVTNKLAHLVVASTYERFGKLPDDSRPCPSGDVGHFFAWIRRMARNDQSDLMKEARELSSQGCILVAIDELVSQASQVPEVQIARILHDNMADILYQRRTGMDIIVSNDLLTPLYKSGLLMTGIYPQLGHVLAGLAHANPHQRVLEIGGGTGGATRIAMEAFHGPNGIKAYRDYTFTDISAGFLSGARESMGHLRDVNFSVFDIEVDPVAQGYAEQAYDLIIACQVLHATSNMQETLVNCRRLLRPGGRLVLVETNQNFIVPGVVVGTFTGYWAGIPDGRVDAPFQSLPGWDRSLREAGFSGLDVVLDDFPKPHNTTSVIVSTFPRDIIAPDPASKALVHLLHGSGPASGLVGQIARQLGQRGIAVKIGTLGQDLDQHDPEARILVLYDPKVLLSGNSGQGFDRLKHLIRKASTLVIVTSCGTVKGHDADGAFIPGLLRVLQNENPANQYASIDIDAHEFEVCADEQEGLAQCIVEREQLLHEARSEVLSSDLEVDPMDREFSWQDGCMWVSRHVPDAGFHSVYGLDSESLKPEPLPLGSQGTVKAAFETPGVPNSLYFVPHREALRPLPPGYVDVAVAAIGLSQHDIGHWTGHTDGDHLSSEFAGTVTAIGSAVQNGLKVGDRVYGLGKGHFGNHVRVPGAFAQKLAEGDEVIKMASMPVAYATAIYALEHVAKLRAGQSILIQSGAHDMGIAAILLAKRKHAHVFATVDSADQASFLVDRLAVPASRIITAPISAQALRRSAQLITNNGAFDLVFSTRADNDQTLDSLLRNLAPLGHFIDIGRRPSTAQTGTARFGALPSCASYCAIDMWTVLDLQPELGAELMQTVDRYYRSGFIEPIPNIESPDVSQANVAIANLSDLIGKLVVSFERPGSLVRMAPPAPTARFDLKSCYVITGALGGLGQSLLRWMADRGARHLALLSRRDVSRVPGAQKLVDSLARGGIQVECFTCDVSKMDQVSLSIDKISSKRPIKGVVHAAVSYMDLTFDKLSAAQWRDSISAKVDGTKNLHSATLGMPLDFFVMATSALSIYAFPTQGAYTAANSFQDAFARYRRSMGLPASTASFGLIREVIDVGTSDATVRLFERNKALTLGESSLLAAFEPAFLNNSTAAPARDEADSGAQWVGQQDDPLSAANIHAFLDPQAMLARDHEELAGGAAMSGAAPRWQHDGRVALMMRAYMDAQRHQSASIQNSSEQEESDHSAAFVRKKYVAAVAEGPSGRDAILRLVQEAIVQAVADMLFVDVESIDPAKSVANLGVDSLIAAELRGWFFQALGVHISMLDLLDPSVGLDMRAASITTSGDSCFLCILGAPFLDTSLARARIDQPLLNMFSRDASRPPNQRTRRPRAARACDLCRTKKNKCDESHPCSYCRSRNVPCVYQGQDPANRRFSAEYVKHLEDQLKRLSALVESRPAPPPHRDVPPVVSGDSSTPDENGRPQELDSIPTVNSATSGRLAGEQEVSGVNRHTSDVEFYGSSSSVALLSQVQHTGQRPRDDDDAGYLVSSLHNTTFPTSSTYVRADAPEVEFACPRYYPQCRGFLESYFTTLHYIYPILDKRDFMQSCETLWSTANNTNVCSSFTALYYSVLSLGAIIGLREDEPVQGLTNLQWCRKFFDMARVCCNQLGLVTDLFMVQCYFIMAKICQNELKPHWSYMYVGLAVRTALAMGINRNPGPNSKKPSTQLRAESRTWWGLYCLEIEMASSVGRPDTLGADIYHNRGLPLVTSETNDSLPVITSLLEPPHCAIISCMVDLSRITRTICQKLYISNTTDFDTVALATQIDKDLDNWLESLPQAIRPPTQQHQSSSLRSAKDPQWVKRQRLVLSIRYHNLRILLFGSLLLRTSATERRAIPGSQEHIQKCLYSAKQTINIIYQTYEHNDFFQTWFYNTTYTVFAASVILLYIIQEAPSDEDARSLFQLVGMAVEILEIMDECLVALEAAKLLRRAIEKAEKRSSSDTAGTDTAGIRATTDSQGEPGDGALVGDAFALFTHTEGHSHSAHINHYWDPLGLMDGNGMNIDMAMQLGAFDPDSSMCFSFGDQ
ncbi:polyketide synthase [Apiospora arundinis]